MADKRKKETQGKEKVRYTLRAMKCTEENMKAVQNERFYRVTPTYILLYECNQRFTKYNRIGEGELKYLNYADKRWLLDCNMAIIAEETEKHKDEVAASMNGMIDRLEAALEAERIKESESDARNDHDTRKSRTE